MIATAAVLAFLLAAQAAGSPSDPQGIRCIYDTVGQERMQGYDAQIEAKTLSIEQFAAATATDRRSCIQRGVWKHQSQVDASFSFALSMATFVRDGKKLQDGGINPDDVLGKWDDMPTDLRAALKAGIDGYPGGDAKFVQDIRTFLTTHTPATRAPFLGHALGMLSAYGAMLRAADDYAAAEAPPAAR